MKNYILLLSELYSEEQFDLFPELDLRSAHETNCYCSASSASHIREQLSDIDTDAVHWIDSGDYHYLSLLFAEKIQGPFHLILFDNHPDDQASAFEEPGILSCGSWVREALKLPSMVSVVWIGGDRSSVEAPIPDDGIPVYVSIDLDCLSEEYFRTDWNQGNLSPADITDRLRSIAGSHRIIGIDICGGLTRAKGATDAILAGNASLRKRLSDELTQLCQTEVQGAPDGVPVKMLADKD